VLFVTIVGVLLTGQTNLFGMNPRKKKLNKDELARYIKGGALDQLKGYIGGKKLSLEAISFIFDRAIESNHLDIVKYIVERETLDKIKKTIKGLDILHKAAKAGRFDFVKYFVEYLEANVNKKDVFERSPLYMAVQGGHLDIVKYFMQPEWGVDICRSIIEEGEEDGPFMGAVEGGNLKIVDYLYSVLEAGGYVKRLCWPDALRNAVESGNLKVVEYIEKKYLENNGDDVAKVIDDNKNTLLHSAAKSVYPKKDDQFLGICRYLVEKKGVDVLAKNDEEKTAWDNLKSDVSLGIKGKPEQTYNYLEKKTKSAVKLKESVKIK